MIRIAAVLITLVSTHAFASDKPAALRIVVDLDDGSRLFGEPSFKSIRFRTTKWEREIPIRSLVSASRGDGTWTIYTEPGNEYSGEVLTASLSMKTLIGPVKVPMRHVVSLETYPAALGITVPHRKDLVLYLSFDRNRGKRARNLASFGHHAKVRGAKWTPKGKRGGAYTFDGKATLEIPHHADLCPKVFTFAAWVFPQDADGRWQLLMSKTNTGSWYGGYGFCRYSGDRRNLYFYNGDYSSGAANATIPQRQWVHIAGVCDGKEVTIYVNGEPSRPRKLASMPVSNAITPALIIGGGGGYNWKGKIDEVLFYRRALTAKEVEQLMIAATPAQKQ